MVWRKPTAGSARLRSQANPAVVVWFAGRFGVRGRCSPSLDFHLVLPAGGDSKLEHHGCIVPGGIHHGSDVVTLCARSSPATGYRIVGNPSRDDLLQPDASIANFGFCYELKGCRSRRPGIPLRSRPSIISGDFHLTRQHAARATKRFDRADQGAAPPRSPELRSTLSDQRPRGIL
jgi:hypothetical protein